MSGHKVQWGDLLLAILVIVTVVLLLAQSWPQGRKATGYGGAVPRAMPASTRKEDRAEPSSPAVPEPATILLFLAGGGAALVAARKRSTARRS